MTERVMLYALLLALLLPCAAHADDTFKDVGHTLRHGIKNASNFMGNALEDTGKAIKHVEHGSTAGTHEAKVPDKQPPQSKDRAAGSPKQNKSTIKTHWQGLLHNLWR